MATPLDYEEEIDRHTAEAERYHTLAAHARKEGRMNAAIKLEDCALSRERAAAQHIRLLASLMQEQPR